MKLVFVRDAIAERVRDTLILLGARLEQMIPFAVAHEIIPQGKRNFTLNGRRTRQLCIVN